MAKRLVVSSTFVSFIVFLLRTKHHYDNLFFITNTAACKVLIYRGELLTEEQSLFPLSTVTALGEIAIIEVIKNY